MKLHAKGVALSSQRFKLSLLGLAGALLLAPIRPAASQQAPNPVLHRRGDSSYDRADEIVVDPRAKHLLPPEASGEYKLSDEGESIEIIDQFGQLSGYLSRKAEGDTDSGELLTWFFSRMTGNEQRLSFTTRQVHGVWYSFEGQLVRGPVPTRAVDGYFLLEGSLVAHDESRKTVQRRQISLKLAGER